MIPFFCEYEMTFKIMFASDLARYTLFATGLRSCWYVQTNLTVHHTLSFSHPPPLCELDGRVGLVPNIIKWLIKSISVVHVICLSALKQDN